MSRGPVILAPKTCQTIELKDLGDVQDFEKNAEIGEVYAFEYTDEGYYKRKALEDGKKPRNPKLEQLRNVEAEGEDNLTYKVTYKDGKWFFNPVIDWQIKFEFISPYTFYAPDKTFRKAINSGPLLISLAYETASRGELELLPFNKTQYLLHRKDSVTKPSTTKLQFVPNFTLPDQYTMIIDISVKLDRATFGLMRGIDINWKDLDVESLRAAVMIQNSGDNVQATVSSDKVNLSITPDQLTELVSINLQYVDLIAFYYTDAVLSEKQLQDLVAKYQ